MPLTNSAANRFRRRRLLTSQSRFASLEPLEGRRVLAVTFTAEAGIVESNSVYPKSVFAADFDGDGDADIVVATYIDNKVTWYENLDGQGTYGDQRLITNLSFGAASVYAADVDGDGDMDVLSASADSYDADVSWYENTDSLGTFSDQKVISAEISGGDSVFAADLDGDGDLDVLSASRGDDKVAWYANLDGLGDFGEQQVISDTAIGATTVFAIDVDADGDVDVISGSVEDNTIAIFENTSNGATFERRVVSEDTEFVTAIFAADIDADGDPDIISTSREDNTVSWFANEAGQFGPERIISLEEGGPNELYVGDVDGDGNLDVVTASRIADRLTWYRNVGKGVFEAPRVLNDQTDGASSVFLVDVDGDDDLDMFSTSRFDNKVALYKNLDGLGSFGTQELLATVGAPGAQLVNVADIDGDGDNDVLTAAFANDTVLWSENLGQGEFGRPQIITDRTNGTEAVVGADFDGDGDIDVASASYFDDKVAWYENTDGAGNFGPQRVVASSGRGPEDLFAVDLDGDDDVDLLSTSRYEDTVHWYENVDGLGTFSAAQLISNSQDGPTIVRAADLDGDGDMDVMANSYDGDVDTWFSWYENLDGEGNFGDEQTISAAVDVPTSLKAADIDDDGDLDIVTTTGGDDRVSWYENTDGNGNFGDEQLISDQLDGAFFVDTADFDGDGDLDVLAGAILQDVVGWYENTDGSGTFSDFQEIDSGVTGATSVLAADLDGDGRPDVLATSSVLDRVTWYRNVGDEGSPPGDLNGDLIVDDGDIDLLCAQIRANGLDNAFDLTGDGSVNRADMDELIIRILGTEFGDSNLDGLFSSGDFIQVFQRGQYEDDVEDNSMWGDGDWNCDGDFSSSDLVVAFQRGGYSEASRPQAVAATINSIAGAAVDFDSTSAGDAEPATVRGGLDDRVEQRTREVVLLEDEVISAFRRDVPEVRASSESRPLLQAVDAAFSQF